MKVFVSYHYDEPLARRVVKTLRQSGLNVWDPEREILPGDNWAEKVAEGLKESDAMVVLLTPDALKSSWVQQEISYALGEKHFNGRLVPVFIGSPESFPENSVPWILRRLKAVNLPEPAPTEEDLQQIAQALKEKEAA